MGMTTTINKSPETVLKSFVRPAALLALFFGFTFQMFLNGQVFTNAVTGIICGCVAVVCGVVSARSWEPRWMGWTMAVLGLALVMWCSAMAPSLYYQQERFNNRHKEYREKMNKRNENSREHLK